MVLASWSFISVTSNQERSSTCECVVSRPAPLSRAQKQHLDNQPPKFEATAIILVYIRLTEDEPELTEIVQGVANRMTAVDVGVVLLLTLTGTIYAFYNEFDIWWMYPIVVGGFVFVVEAVQWYYSDYRQQLLQAKAERLADGEDIDPKIDTGKGLTSFYSLSLIGSIITWGLIIIHLLRPIVGRYPATYTFFGGTMVIIIVISVLFKKAGRID